MTKDWTFEVGLWECSKMYQQTITEENLPFVPKEGNVFWMSDSCENRLRIKIRKCLKKNGCGDGCPFTNADGKVFLKDEVIVHEVYFKVDDHEIALTLRKNGIVRNQVEP
jgi:hypothetical protein